MHKFSADSENSFSFFEQRDLQKALKFVFVRDSPDFSIPFTELYKIKQNQNPEYIISYF